MKLQLIFKRILSYFPTPLPVGMAAHKKWATEIIELSGQMANEDDMRFVIATSIMHMPQTAASVPKNHFVRLLRKAAANQIASAAFQEIKLAREAQIAAQIEADKIKSEDTVSVETASLNGQVQN